MTENNKRTGGCLCGAVRYELTGEPYVAGLCHCTICRKLTGSAFSATANWRREQFTMTGTVATFERRQFCPTCGARLFFFSDNDIEVFLGTLDQAPYDIPPNLEVWAIRREHWLPKLPDVAVHRQNPDA
jgi:hypothetical protein